MHQRNCINPNTKPCEMISSLVFYLRCDGPRIIQTKQITLEKWDFYFRLFIQDDTWNKLKINSNSLFITIQTHLSFCEICLRIIQKWMK